MLGMNIWAALAAGAVMFLIGSFWYMALFAKQWGEMFGYDKMSKKEQAEARKGMGTQMAVQVVITFMSAFALAKLMALAPSYSSYKMAFVVWLGFATPVAVSSVIFGGVESKWVKRRIGIMISESLVHLLAAAWVISLIQK